MPGKIPQLIAGTGSGDSEDSWLGEWDGSGVHAGNSSDEIHDTGLPAVATSPAAPTPTRKRTVRKKKKIKPRAHTSPRRGDDYEQGRLERRYWLHMHQHQAMVDAFQEREEKRLAAEVERVERRVRVRLGQSCRLWTVNLCWHSFAEKLRVALAMYKLTKLFYPICMKRCWVKSEKRRRLSLTQTFRELMEEPDTHVLRACSVFKTWPHQSLLKLLSQCQPICFCKNEAIFFQGDWGDAMYLVAGGIVQVIVKKKNSGCKSCTAENGTIVASLEVGSYFGEFAILTDEPRMATCWASTEVQLWLLPRAAVEGELESLPDGLKTAMIKASDDRRTENMYKLYPFTTGMVQKSCRIFQRWPTEKVDDLLKKMIPTIYRPGEVIIREGDAGTGMYFVARGKADVFITIKNADGEPEQKRIWGYKKGDSFGELGVIFMEPRQASVITTRPCDIWVLPKSEMLEVLHRNPQLFREIKQIANLERASRLKKFPESFVEQNAILFNLLPTVALSICYPKLEPFVFDYTYPVFNYDDTPDKLLFLVEGKFDIYPPGTPYTIGTIGPGTCIGQYETLFSSRWGITAKATCRCVVWALPRAILSGWLNEQGVPYIDVVRGILTPLRNHFDSSIYWPTLSDEITYNDYYNFNRRVRRLFARPADAALLIPHIITQTQMAQQEARELEKEARRNAGTPTRRLGTPPRSLTPPLGWKGGKQRSTTPIRAGTPVGVSRKDDKRDNLTRTPTPLKKRRPKKPKEVPAELPDHANLIPEPPPPRTKFDTLGSHLADYLGKLPTVGSKGPLPHGGLNPDLVQYDEYLPCRNTITTMKIPFSFSVT